MRFLPHRTGGAAVTTLAAILALAACSTAPAPTTAGTRPAATAPARGASTASSGTGGVPGSVSPSTPAGTPSAGTTPAGTSSTGGVPAFSHVFVLVMENLSYQAAMATPGFSVLARRYASASAYYAAAHPSLPNYLALTGGSTFGTTSDCLTCFVSADNLGAQLSRAGISWGAYMEQVSGPCYLGTSYGVYAAKHNPFRYYTDIRSSPTRCAHLVPLSQLDPLLAGPASGVPRLVWVTPDVCNDGHSCPAAQAASWLDGFVARVTASAAWRQGGVLFVTWDEGSGGDTRQATPAGSVTATGGGGHVLTLVIAPGVPAGTVVTTPLSHFALLATVEDAFGLPLLGQAAAWSDRTLARFFVPSARAPAG